MDKLLTCPQCAGAKSIDDEYYCPKCAEAWLAFSKEEDKREAKELLKPDPNAEHFQFTHTPVNQHLTHQ